MDAFWIGMSASAASIDRTGCVRDHWALSQASVHHRGLLCAEHPDPKRKAAPLGKPHYIDEQRVLGRAFLADGRHVQVGRHLHLHAGLRDAGEADIGAGRDERVVRGHATAHLVGK